MFERLVCLQQPQKMKRAVQHADVLIGGDRNDGMACKSSAANDIAFSADAIQAEMHRRDEGRGLRRSKDDTAIPAGLR